MKKNIFILTKLNSNFFHSNTNDSGLYQLFDIDSMFNSIRAQIVFVNSCPAAFKRELQLIVYLPNHRRPWNFSQHLWAAN